MTRREMSIEAITARWQDETMDANDGIVARDDIYWLLDAIRVARDRCGRRAGVCLPSPLDLRSSGETP
jgi:hypothetical protein